MDNRYKVTIFWSNEDGAYVAEVPELPGCMADGQTRQEAVTNIEHIIQEWITQAKELGRPIPDAGQEGNNRVRQPGVGIGKLRIIEDDESHLSDFRDYMP